MEILLNELFRYVLKIKGLKKEYINTVIILKSTCMALKLSNQKAKLYKNVRKKIKK